MIWNPKVIDKVAMKDGRVRISVEAPASREKHIIVFVLLRDRLLGLAQWPPKPGLLWRSRTDDAPQKYVVFFKELL